MRPKDDPDQGVNWRSLFLVATTFLFVLALLLAVESVSNAAAISIALLIVVVGIVLLKSIK